uniref:Uncharacterized protein n=1 Tax=Meloidogyne enterolobii TaxID=390850 RepID=A0A6V7TYJ7_MELEN|nr:unnamed protein product [Meloidogyne enterolobii]
MDNQEEIDNENIESDLSEGEGIHVTEKQAKISINLNEPEDSLCLWYNRNSLMIIKSHLKWMKRF